MAKRRLLLAFIVVAVFASRLLVAATGAANTADWTRSARRDMVMRQGLPDALTLRDGTAVESAEVWTAQRRAELMELFQYFVYEYFPGTPATSYELAAEDHGALGGLAT